MPNPKAETDRILSELRKSEKRFRTVFEASPLGITVLDIPNGVLPSVQAVADTPGETGIYINRAWEKMLGYTQEELFKVGITNLSPPEDMAKDIALFTKLLAGEIDNYELEKRYFKKDGTMMWGKFTAVVGRDDDGKALIAVGIVEDITERKRAEEASQMAIDVRDNFIAVASHELRTPITPLKLQVGLLKRFLEREGKAIRGAKNFLRLLDDSLHQLDLMNNLIEDMLDVSAISTGKLPVRPSTQFDLAELVNRVMDRYSGSFKESRCTLNLILQPVIGNWDRMRIEQAINNLVSNALKFASGKPIEIEVSRIADQAVFRIADHGVGISSEDMARVFDKFERAKSFRDYPGLGLGLYITREIVKLHGGSIEVKSEVGKGATFILSLPLNGSGGSGQT